MEVVSSPSMRKQYFVAINLLGERGSMQMTVMSEGSLLQAFVTQLPLVIVCHELII